MENFHESMLEYRKQMERVIIHEAYRGLMDYFNTLKNHFEKNYPDYFVSTNVYYGFMDMTYFSFTPESFKHKKLKIAIVFLHKEFRFEVWLAANNRGIQREYWRFLKEEEELGKYQLVELAKGVDAIIEHVLIENPDFRDLDDLTKQIESETLKFINDIETYLSSSL